MKKVYHLSTCTTCKRILKEVSPGDDFQFNEIKSSGISEEQLEEMKTLAGSYRELFSRQARKYREMNLHLQELTEKEMKKLILSEYTFLKRPVFIINKQIFVGSKKRTLADLTNFVRFSEK
ncbi:hypothetical protein OAA06_01535 [bacterium]|nr:hypothetical protein [bacterium]